MPMDRECIIAECTYFFADAMASVTVIPFARLAAIADDNVQPVPCVFLVTILFDL